MIEINSPQFRNFRYGIMFFSLAPIAAFFLGMIQLDSLGYFIWQLGFVAFIIGIYSANSIQADKNALIGKKVLQLLILFWTSQFIFTLLLGGRFFPQFPAPESTASELQVYKVVFFVVCILILASDAIFIVAAKWFNDWFNQMTFTKSTSTLKRLGYLFIIGKTVFFTGQFILLSNSSEIANLPYYYILHPAIMASSLLIVIGAILFILSWVYQSYAGASLYSHLNKAAYLQEKLPFFAGSAVKTDNSGFNLSVHGELQIKTCSKCGWLSNIDGTVLFCPDCGNKL